MEGDITYSPARGRNVQPKKRKKIQHKQRYHTVPYIALYHDMREQGSLVAPRLRVEEGVGRAELNKHENPTVLRLRWRRDYPDLGPTLGGGVGRTEKKMVRTALHPDKKLGIPQTKNKNSKPHNPEKKLKTLEERRGLESQLVTAAPRGPSTLR